MLKEAMLYKVIDRDQVQCYLCNHKCKILDSKFGFCGMRQNIKGKLYTYAYGEVIAANEDPIEKKPLYHVLPGTTSFSIATAGCNFRCAFCQNWQISQISKKKEPNLRGYRLLPDEIISKAKQYGCRSISYTYTEPTIFFEYAYDTSKLAKEEGLLNVFVTNGFMTKETLDTIHPYLDASNVDLKSFSDDFYKKVCHGRLKPVLESIEYMKTLGIWVEVTTLVVPGSNDSEEELRGIANFIANVDRDIPWHISRFHPDYQFTNIHPTPISTLELAYNIGKEAGLRYIYIGNVPGETPQTICPNCGKVVLKREGFWLMENNIKDSKCIFCGQKIPGIFD
ncbi:MAG: AmmeMemoRadiSam system radical SAM enzyme [Nitrospirae bacterium]|nr:MAG: AmmeMemoRadiSam system radical SAM enzyme [Nitrospirota bacterium]